MPSPEGRQPGDSPTGGNRVVVVATALDADLVESIRAVDDRLQVLHQPDLLPPSRFPGDHRGLESFRRTEDQDHRWRAMLSRAEILLGLPGDSGAGLAEAVAISPGLRWVQATAAGAGEQVEAAGLSDLLPVAHGVVITLPLTDETRGLIDANAVARMRTGAILINVGRGGVINESALVQALEEGRLGGAALDVFATEPLGPDSALWSLPNVLISPHTAALSVHENERIVALFRENLRRYLVGGELISRVDPKLRY